MRKDDEPKRERERGEERRMRKDGVPKRERGEERKNERRRRTKVGGQPGDVILAAAITAELIGGDVADVSDQGLLELHQALVLPRPLPVVLEGAVERLLLGVEQDGHPLLAVRVRLGLEVVGPAIIIYSNI